MITNAQIAIIVVILIVVIVAVALYADDRKKKGSAVVGGSALGACPACPGCPPGIPCNPFASGLPRSYQDKASGKTLYQINRCSPTYASLYKEAGTSGETGMMLVQGDWTQTVPRTSTNPGYAVTPY